MPYYVYILASQKNGTLYIGVTSNLQERVAQHKSKHAIGFTEKYNVSNLVYFEEFDKPEDAIQREKQLKGWRRNWKLELIEKDNPNWRDLAQDAM